jgi:cell division protein FtsB
VNKLEEQKEFFIQEIKQTKEEQQELLSSPEKLEKFAREKYYMKKDNEDLFIIAPAPAQ